MMCRFRVTIRVKRATSRHALCLATVIALCVAAHGQEEPLVVSTPEPPELSIEEAVAHPRIHVTPDSIVYFESNKFSEEEINDIKTSGFKVELPPTDIIINKLNPYFGGVHAVAYEKNQWTGAADPRRDGNVGNGNTN